MNKQTDRIGVAALAVLALGGGGLSAFDILGGGRRTHSGGTNQSPDAVDREPPTEEEKAEFRAYLHRARRGPLTSSQKRAIKRPGSPFRLEMEAKFLHNFEAVFADILEDKQ